MKNKKNNRYLIIGIGYLILFFIVLTPDINNAVGRGIQALLFCVLGYRCEENIRRFIKIDNKRILIKQRIYLRYFLLDNIRLDMKKS